MNDAQRYRMNAAKCLSTAERSGPSYHGLTIAIAASWFSLARQQEAMDELLAIWRKAHAGKSAPRDQKRFQYPRELRCLSFAESARGRNTTSVQFSRDGRGDVTALKQWDTMRSGELSPSTIL
jgi:hypothetical protein